MPKNRENSQFKEPEFNQPLPMDVRSSWKTTVGIRKAAGRKGRLQEVQMRT